MYSKMNQKVNAARASTHLFLLLLSMVVSLSAQSSGKIRGQVTDARSGLALPGVNIHVQGSTKGTTSDLEGNFELPELSTDTYALRFSMMGYAPYTAVGLQVASGIPLDLSVQLKPNVLASPQVVVTSSRKEQDILESPFTVSAIGAREIASKAVVSMVDVLEYEPGVSTVKGQLNLRGTSGYTLGAGTRSLLLLDGIPMLGSAGGNVTWSTVPTSEIARVEIVRSGGSALYGSSAMGGVVNVITRNPPPQPESRISTKVGVYSYPRIDQWQWRDSRGLLYNTEFSHSRSLGPHAVWLRVQKRSDDGFMELNWQEAINVSGKLKLNFGNAHSAAIFANILDESEGLLSVWKNPASPFEAPEGSANDFNAGTKYILNGHYNYVYSPDLVIKTKASGYWNQWTTTGTTAEDSKEGRYYEEVQVTKSWSEAFNTILGTTLQQNTVDAQIFGQHTSKSMAGFLSLVRKIHDLTVSFGSRYEIYRVDGKDQDQVFTPQIALNWKPLPWLALRSSRGKGFRVPTVAEMFTSTRRSIFTVEPNPELVSETSINSELGLVLFVGDTGPLDLFKLDGAIFHNRFENFIEPIPNKDAVIHFKNISDARIMGLELGLVASAFNNTIDYKSAFTLLDPVKLDSSGQVQDTLSYRHRYLYNGTLGLHRWGMDMALEYRYASRVESVELFDESLITGQDIRVPIHIWNAGIGTTYGSWFIMARVENIFQYYYTQLERNIAEERMLSITIERRFE